MYKIIRYSESDIMSDLICENYPMLLVMSRFGISLGFGDSSILKVCQENKVDVKTFLAVVNLLVDDDSYVPDDISEISLVSLLGYLKNSHKYFLEFRFPIIRQELMKAIDYGKTDVSKVIIRFYDEYVVEVRRHMNYEEDNLFPYVDKLIAGEKQKSYNIGVFSRQHDKIDTKLSELKDIIIKYFPAEGTNELNATLFDIFSCSQDLASHNKIEDALFVPIVEILEKKLKH
ncbi:MAG: hemerythrin domain-containing protein [Bacteroidetes bacterium]|nr:hemerythrin domain-containing protein [Bacteroidota bacterium]